MHPKYLRTLLNCYTLVYMFINISWSWD